MLTQRLEISILLMLTTLAPVALRTAAAQAPSREQPHYYVVQNDDTPVRSNAAPRAYVFGHLQQNDVVKVIDERDGWLRVAMFGPAVRDFYGYLKYRADETGRYAISRGGDGRQPTLTTLGIASLVAPNLDAEARPEQSWKTILRLPADTTLSWLEVIETEREVIHRVRLPEAAEGWVNPSRVRRATTVEVERWQETMRRAESETAQDRQRAGDRPQREAQPPQRNAETQTDARSPQSDRDRSDDVRRAAADDDRAARRSDDADDAPTREATGNDTDRPADASPPQAQTNQPGAADISKADDTETEDAGDAPPADAPRPTLEQLEAALDRVRREPIATAEVEELRRLYLTLAEQLDPESTELRIAQTRAEQLSLRMEIQRRRAELRELELRVQQASEAARERRLAFEAASIYDVVGVLHASTIYDGKRLPRLFRVQEPVTGRTLAYLRAEDEFDLVGMAGQLVGVVGPRRYDGGLRLHVIRPRRIDMLGAARP